MGIAPGVDALGALGLAGMGGASLGGKGGKGGGDDSRAASFATHLANYYTNMTAPLTRRAVARGRKVMGSPAQQKRFARKHIYGSPIYKQAAGQSMEPVRTTMEDQYRRAQENIIANMPSGGTMRSTLMDLDMDRAQQMGNMEAQNQQRLNQLAQSMWSDEISRAYGIAAQAPPSGMSSLGAAAAAQAQQSAAQYSGKLGALGGFGQGAGNIIGSLIENK